MKRTVFLFPGQGAQFVGMGSDFSQAFSSARSVFEEADELMQERLSRVIFEGPSELLVQTRYSQLAIFVVSIAILRVLQELMSEVRPEGYAGLSLGEYTALCASGRLSFAETFSLIDQRARWMQEACEANPGTMAAVLGLEKEVIEDVLSSQKGVWIANYNCPGQIVISGTQEAVTSATLLLKEAKAKRVLPLAVSGAFHSPLMEPAQELLSSVIAQLKLQEQTSFIAMNASGTLEVANENIRSLLQTQMVRPVYWEQGMRAMDQRGIELYVEIGCGAALAGFHRRIGVAGQIQSIQKVDDLVRYAEIICHNESLREET